MWYNVACSSYCHSKPQLAHDMEHQAFLTSLNKLLTHLLLKLTEEQLSFLLGMNYYKRVNKVTLPDKATQTFRDGFVLAFTIDTEVTETQDPNLALLKQRARELGIKLEN